MQVNLKPECPASRDKASRIHLKNRILVQDRGGAEFKTGGMLLYVKDLRPTMKIKLGGSSRNAGKRGTNPAKRREAKRHF